MKKTLIYILKCPISYEVRYVGKTVDLKSRFSSHLSSWNKNRITYVANWIFCLKKNNQKPIMDVIEECYDNWAERERYWISYYKNLGAKLCNLTDGGEGMLGYATSEREVYQFTLTGVFVKQYKSATAASKENGIEIGHITKCARGEQARGSGFYWSYKNEFSYKKIKSHHAKSVMQFTKSGHPIKEYESLLVAENETKISRNNIRAVCRNRAITAGGFIWKYKTAI